MFWLATEIGRAITELGISIPYRKFSHKNYQGDGHPGFMATDMSTGPLRKFIENLAIMPMFGKWEGIKRN